MSTVAPQSDFQKSVADPKSEAWLPPKEDAKPTNAEATINGVGPEQSTVAQPIAQPEPPQLQKSEGAIKFPVVMPQPRPLPSVQGVTYSTRTIDNVGNYPVTARIPDNKETHSGQ